MLKYLFASLVALTTTEIVAPAIALPEVFAVPDIPAVIAQSTSDLDASVGFQDLPWQQLSSDSGRYLVDLPGSPVRDTATSVLLNQELQWQINSVTTTTTDDTDLFEYYFIAYADLPRSLSYQYSQETILNAAVAEVTENIQAPDIRTTFTDEPIAYNGLPSRLMTAEGYGQYVISSLSITGDRLYLLIAVDDDIQNFTHFFDSVIFVP